MFRRYLPQHARGRVRRKAATVLFGLSAVAGALVVTVHSGDTLSAIAKAHCGQAADWTGIWQASHKAHLIGVNPDLIYPGQHVVISCRTASVPARAADTASRPVTSSRDGDGDYDNDRSDAAASPGGSSGSAPVTHVTAQQGSVPGGTLDQAGLSRLWIAAGGPGWAAWRMGEIGMCESGGRQFAYNPSGASGYWQILGQVVGGWIYDPMVNAENAVSKFDTAQRYFGNGFEPWVCQ